jgi:hypothetical protein
VVTDERVRGRSSNGLWISMRAAGKRREYGY